MKLRIKSTETTLLILGIYQIIGAIVGFYIIASLLFHTGAINGPLLLILFIAIGLYLLSLKAGTLLLKKEYKSGIIVSMVSQALQLVSIAFGGYKYFFISGAKFNAGFNFTEGFLFNFDFGITSTFTIMLNVSDKEYYIYLNLLAVFLLYLFNDLYLEITSDKVQNAAIEESISNMEIN
ncbi:hypothetical protein [Labilibaculum euxinus]